VIERLLHWRAGRLVFDFDDAIHVPSSAYANGLDRLRDFGKPAWLAGQADLVVPGSAHLAEFAIGAGADPRRVCVLPTVVDTGIFRPDPARRDPGRLTIGWIGTPRGTSYLHPLLPAMQNVSQTCPNARFVFVGAEPFDCGGLDVSFPAWQLDREVADVQSFDIGLMPVTDDAEGRGKCGFKIIEYMAAGAAVVCSPVGANRDIVLPGKTGFFATTPEDWAHQMLTLARDPALRAEMGSRGRARAEALYSLAATSPRMLQILHAAAEGRPPDLTAFDPGPA
jgi:glycosyltransferase involved in cell wall biosynthesis